jgi:trimethylamine--corrinoid protein Co-methyltransferase
VVEADGTRRLGLMEDYLQFARLVHQSRFFHVNGGILVHPSDVHHEHCRLLMAAAAILHSDKCLLGIPGSEADVEGIATLADLALSGRDLTEGAASVLTLVSITSPLQIDPLALETIRVCARRRQPVIVSPSPIAGITSPITAAGSLSQGNAEALAGIALVQILGEGTPVVYGLNPIIGDMRIGGIILGSPAYALQAVWSVRLARFYGLPSRAGGNCNDAEEVSAPSGYQGMLNMLVTCHEGANVILHSAGILDRYAAMSYEKFVSDLEVISMVEHLLSELEISPDRLALDAVREAGPGGQFLTIDHTYDHCNGYLWESGLRIRRCAEHTDYNRRHIDALQERVAAMLEDYTRPDLDPEIEREILARLENAGIDTQPILPAAGLASGF